MHVRVWVRRRCSRPVAADGHVHHPQLMIIQRSAPFSANLEAEVIVVGPDLQDNQSIQLILRPLLWNFPPSLPSLGLPHNSDFAEHPHLPLYPPSSGPRRGLSSHHLIFKGFDIAQLRNRILASIP